MTPVNSYLLWGFYHWAQDNGLKSAILYIPKHCIVPWERKNLLEDRLIISASHVAQLAIQHNKIQFIAHFPEYASPFLCVIPFRYIKCIYCLENSSKVWFRNKTQNKGKPHLRIVK